MRAEFCLFFFLLIGDRLHHLEHTALVPFARETLFGIVADVESYPRFLPGCSAADVEPLSDTTLRASLRVSQGPFSHWFSTLNTLEPHERITLELIEGPFQALNGEWRFSSRGEAATEVALELHFAFKSRWVDRMLAPAFSRIAKSMVTSFSGRARSLTDPA